MQRRRFLIATLALAASLALGGCAPSSWNVHVGSQQFVVRVGQQEVMQQQVIIPQNDMESIVLAAADEFGVPQTLALAVLEQESGGDPGSVSWVGARGLMQIMPATGAGIAQELGVTDYNLDDPATNARFGMFYLKGKLDRYGHDWGLAAYNWGPSEVDKFLEQHPEAAQMVWSDVIARWRNEIPGETQNYVTSITALEQRSSQAQPVARASDSRSYVLEGDVGVNVRAALNANNGAIRHFTIQPGETWSFGHSIAPISAMGYLPVVCGPAGCNAGGGWCDLSAMYVRVADQLGLQSNFPPHGGISDPRFPGILLDEWGNGGDLTITNTTNSSVTFTATEYDGTLTVSAG